MSDAMLSLFELAGAEDDRLFSPFAWRIRLALDHKGLSFTSLPWRFTEKDRLSPANLSRVPVLVDGDQWLGESWMIALHLERRFPDRPTLFSDDAGVALAALATNWLDQTVMSALFPLLICDIHDVLASKDQDYFRQSREKQLGCSLEDACPDPERQLATFRRALAPARTTLKRQAFLGGSEPLYPDLVLSSLFQWAHAVSEQSLLAPDDILNDWLARMALRQSPSSRALRRRFSPKKVIS